MLNGIFGDDLSNGQRYVVLGGGFNYDAPSFSNDALSENIYSTLFGYDRTDGGKIGANMKDYLNSNGWNVQSFDVSTGSTNQYGFTATLYLYNNYTAEQARQSMLDLLKSGYGADKGFSNFFVQIISDANVNKGKVISDINPKQVAQAPKSGGAIVSKAAADTASQVAKDGVTPTLVGGLDTLLFGGKTIDILGAKIPVFLIYGVIGIIAYPIVIDTVQGKRR